MQHNGAERAGVTFEEADVVENYSYRPPYPDALFSRLLELAPRRTSLLDIGCGPDKISRPLAPHFTRVTAVDPSREMIALGRSLDGGCAGNIDWVEGFAENFPIGEKRFGLTVAAASIHWMDHARLFPRLAAHANSGHLVAVVSGDTPFEPSWDADWQIFLAKWVPVLSGKPFEHDRKSEERSSYRAHLDVLGEDHLLSSPFQQSVADFIGCQHSRDTFAASRLASYRGEFDAELAELLTPHATDGLLTFTVETTLTWGAIASR